MKLRGSLIVAQSYGFSRATAREARRFLTPQGVTLNFSKHLLTFAQPLIFTNLLVQFAGQ